MNKLEILAQIHQHALPHDMESWLCYLHLTVYRKHSKAYRKVFSIASL